MNCYKYCCLSLVSLFLVAPSAFSNEVTASSFATQQLETEAKSSVYLSRNNRTREYTYKAADSKTLSNSNLVAVQGYKVEVYGSSREILQDVRNVEPKAFVKDNIIQVGIFSQQNNAEDMVRKLASRGFWARIITQ